MLRERLECIASREEALVLILLLCLALRIGIAANNSNRPLRGDAVGYVSIARHLACGDGFVIGPLHSKCAPTGYGNPIYPVFLALIFRLFGFSLQAVMLIQAVLDTLTCFLIFSLALRVTQSHSTAVLSALFYAVYPPFVLSVGSILTETLTILLLVCAIYLYWMATKGHVRRAVAAGAVMGVAMLLKPAMLLFPAFAVAGFWLNRRTDGGWLVKGVVYFAMCCAVMSPWTVRNYIVLGRFIPVATHGGATLWGGTGVADGKCMPHAHMAMYVPGDGTAPVHGAFPVSKATYDKIMDLRNRLRGLDEAGQDALYRQAALQEIKEHPGRFAFLAVKKFFRLWFNLWHEDPPSRASMAMAVLNLFLLVLAFKASARRRVDEGFVRLVLVLAVYTTVVSMLTFSMIRYSYPVFPFILILAAAGMASRPIKQVADPTVFRPVEPQE